MPPSPAPILDAVSVSTPAAVGKLVMTLVAAALLALFATAWNGKADKNDVDALRNDVQRVLDLLCADKPSARQCNGN